MDICQISYTSSPKPSSARRAIPFTYFFIAKIWINIRGVYLARVGPQGERTPSTIVLAVVLFFWLVVVVVGRCYFLYSIRLSECISYLTTVSI